MCCGAILWHVMMSVVCSGVNDPLLCTEGDQKPYHGCILMASLCYQLAHPG